MADIEKRLHLAVPIVKVWAALTDPGAIGGWMGSVGLQIELKVGGHYKFFGGETTGKFTKIESPRVLEYTWRQSSWKKDWKDSVVRWELRASKGGTSVNLTHTNFPNEEERDSHDEGWDLYWLEPMQAWLESKD